MNDVIAELLKQLKTRDGVSDFINRLNMALLELSGADLKHLETYFSRKEIALLLKVIKKMSDLKNVRDDLAKVSVVTIRIPFKASVVFENSISDYIFKKAREPCVVQILTDRNLIAGAVIDFKGTYRDYSLRTLVDEWRKQKQI